MIKRCKCGCGCFVKVGCLFLPYHHLRVQSVETRRRISNSKIGTSPWNKGRQLSTNHRRRLSESHSKLVGELNSFHGKKHTVSTKLKLADFARSRTGWTHSEESKLRISDSHRGMVASDGSRRKMSLAKKGDRHPNWKGGISKLPYPFQFQEVRKEILKRDGNRCMNNRCSQTTNRLCVHHIDYDKTNLRSNNLVTVCIACNSAANYGRSNWFSHFQQILGAEYGYIF